MATSLDQDLNTMIELVQKRSRLEQENIAQSEQAERAVSKCLLVAAGMFFALNFSASSFVKNKLDLLHKPENSIAAASLFSLAALLVCTCNTKWLKAESEPRKDCLELDCQIYALQQTCNAFGDKPLHKYADTPQYYKKLIAANNQPEQLI